MFIYLAALGLRRRQWHPTPVLLPGKSHGQRSLAGYSPWGRKELDMTDLLTLTTAVVQFCYKIPAMMKERRVMVVEERDIFFPFSKIEKKCILIMRSLDNK